MCWCHFLCRCIVNSCFVKSYGSCVDNILNTICIKASQKQWHVEWAFYHAAPPTWCMSSWACTAGMSPPTGRSCSSCWLFNLSQFNSSCSDMWTLFQGAISESRWALETETQTFFPFSVVSTTVIYSALHCWTHCNRSPHAEGLVVQVIPPLGHVAKASPEQNTILGVPQWRKNPLPIFIQRVIQFCVAVNLYLEVLYLPEMEKQHEKPVNSVTAHT